MNFPLHVPVQLKHPYSATARCPSRHPSRRSPRLASHHPHLQKLRQSRHSNHTPQASTPPRLTSHRPAFRAPLLRSHRACRSTTALPAWAALPLTGMSTRARRIVAPARVVSGRRGRTLVPRMLGMAAGETVRVWRRSEDVTFSALDV